MRIVDVVIINMTAVTMIEIIIAEMADALKEGLIHGHHPDTCMVTD